MVNYKQTFLFSIREDSLKRILYNTSKWHTFPYKPITRGKKETCRWEITSLQLWLFSNSSFLIPGSAKELSGRRYILAWNNASSYPPAAVSILTAMRLTSQFHLILLPPFLFVQKLNLLIFTWGHVQFALSSVLTYPGFGGIAHENDSCTVS